MFEDTSMVQEVGRYAKRHFGAFNLAERLIASGITFFLIGSATLSAQTPTKIWVDSTADNNWFTGNNWTPTGFPGNTDIVAVNNGTTAQIGAAGAEAGPSSSEIPSLAARPWPAALSSYSLEARSIFPPA